MKMLVEKFEGHEIVLDTTVKRYFIVPPAASRPWGYSTLLEARTGVKRKIQQLARSRARKEVT